MQLDHYSTHFEKHTFPITLVCENVTNAPNIGSLFRTADAFGITELIFCGAQIPLGRKMTKTSRATEKAVKHSVETEINDVISELKRKGFYIVSLEITTQSTALTHYTFPKNTPIALVIGDENFGVSQEVLKSSDAVIHIDMYGQNSSMNVVQATSITLYEITKQLKSN
ncbi:TrmH family RNA methyltransferase [Psychroserpens sp. SPM9]|uniref:TrmH family RNA methyltransferase n=1 Tax=Psychroserpens sp. SPM9 TaxID=2975598 RepID=UPI0021A34E32|nr:TrmH family RNA methyltransferase [Psychroserpens sp. SPM9]MDG5491537.1 TrmH family RNA methyltransferase [Psychroserpens sp. SPM9]